MKVREMMGQNQGNLPSARDHYHYVDEKPRKPEVYQAHAKQKRINSIYSSSSMRELLAFGEGTDSSHGLITTKATVHSSLFGMSGSAVVKENWHPKPTQKWVEPERTPLTIQ
jgi:hypothetical protein